MRRPAGDQARVWGVGGGGGGGVGCWSPGRDAESESSGRGMDGGASDGARRDWMAA